MSSLVLSSPKHPTCVRVAPERKQVLVTPPTYRMYSICAKMNDVGMVKVSLEFSGDAVHGGEKGRFRPRRDEVERATATDSSIKLSSSAPLPYPPGNTTGAQIPLLPPCHP
ncbi:hypothetical protein BDQ12DRAFT_694602 [Crucibulum laeve]|uniref:Uncharacterized protein n=1 Tax=Crucibulum laeve TaxID=68775 RepID=A0A5C3LFV2_9AGAR|nr:hypothetical protein BDQ12DRAFT_694602 [Crucibulum laeve]